MEISRIVVSRFSNIIERIGFYIFCGVWIFFKVAIALMFVVIALWNLVPFVWYVVIPVTIGFIKLNVSMLGVFLVGAFLWASISFAFTKVKTIFTFKGDE